ncbi:hypothetical protein [Alloactinosynnema sp. L-07]|uniref:hypothetical protein n=1 Tax=Alloactinosynnema sp. L-07 TaxID=1653480 RepID=UPI0012F876F0|nr:hypothetical protein [Alloactinosynnema sp. L-07]
MDTTELRQRAGDQPLPVPNDRPSVQSLVRADLDAREKLGVSRYGTALQAHNGRDMLRDAYDEAMDLTTYLRGVIEERDNPAVSTEDTDLREQTARAVFAAMLKREGVPAEPARYDQARASRDDVPHADLVDAAVSVVRPRFEAKDKDLEHVGENFARAAGRASRLAAERDSLLDRLMEACAEVERLRGDALSGKYAPVRLPDDLDNQLRQVIGRVCPGPLWREIRDAIVQWLMLLPCVVPAPVSSAEPEQDDVQPCPATTHDATCCDHWRRHDEHRAPTAGCPWCPDPEEVEQAPVYVWRKGAPEPRPPYPIMTTSSGSSWARYPNIPGQSYGHWIRRDREDKVLLWSELVERALSESAVPVQAQPRTMPEWVTYDFGFCAFRTTSLRDLAAALEAVRRAVCAYGGDGRCDCKYGANPSTELRVGTERTGCPELRELIHRLLARPESLTEVVEQAPAGQDGQHG